MSETDFESLTVRVSLGGLLLMVIVIAAAVTEYEMMRYIAAAGIGAIAWPMLRWYRELL